MPYYVYRIATGSTGQVKGLELLECFDQYRSARDRARAERAEQDDARVAIKLVFADNELEAEERLRQVREQPVLKEWEK